MIKVIDQFIPDWQAIRQDALNSEFIDWQGHDGEVYKRICLKDIPAVREAIEDVMGPVDMLGMAYRLNFDGELPNAAIHSDMGWGTHALVFYLNDGESGTAFWKHKATGRHDILPGDFELYAAVKSQWDDESAWEQVKFVPMKAGRALIYESKLFHSRYPFKAFGDCPENGRLIVVAFFTPRQS